MNITETANTIQAQKDFTKKFLRAVKEASTIGDEQVTDTFKETIQRVVGSLIRDIELRSIVARWFHSSFRRRLRENKK